MKRQLVQLPASLNALQHPLTTHDMHLQLAFSIKLLQATQTRQIP